MRIRKITDRKPRILLVQGSPRDIDSCADMTSKSELLVDFLVEKWSNVVDFDVLDLKPGKVTIRPCKGCVSSSGGMHCHWKCVAEDQRVHTIDGFKEIKDLKCGDILQDGNRVLKHLMTSDSEDIYELKLSDGRSVHLTSDHKVKILSNERFRTKDSNWKFFRKETWVGMSEIKVGDIVPSIDLDDKFFSDEKVENVDFLKYGLIWGDGTFANDNAILYVDENQSDYFENIKLKFQDNIISILPHRVNNSRTINESVNEYTTVMNKITFGSEFGRKMKSVGFVKTKAHHRRLPINSFDNDSNKIFSFLNGWISTDGSVTKKGIKIYNTSYDCLRDLQLLLSRVGIKSSISDIRHLNTIVRGKKIQRCSSISINGYDSVKIIYDNLKLIHPKKQSNLELFILNLKRKMVNKPAFVSSITHIGKKPVYDIEVEKSHEFNCEGIKIHNCSCFGKDMEVPDLMYEEDVYTRLEECDGFMIVSPIHWYAVSTQVKAMFDRLVCCNLTITKDQALQIFGKGNIKNSEMTGRAELSGKYKHLLKNHLEGKWAAFFVHGDDGANDYGGGGPNIGDRGWDVKNCVLPLVYQCRFSGINCPDELVEAIYVNKGIPYHEANLRENGELYVAIDGLMERMVNFMENF